MTDSVHPDRPSDSVVSAATPGRSVRVADSEQNARTSAAPANDAGRSAQVPETRLDQGPETDEKTPTCICSPRNLCAMHAAERAAFERLWTEPFLLMSAPDDDPCVVRSCKTKSPTRWQVEVIGYQGHGEAPLTGPTFTACLSHLTQQMNRFLPIGGRRG